MVKKRKPLPTPMDDRIVVELQAAGNRAVKTQSEKKNYAQAFSNALARKVANGLRPKFQGILPDEDGQRAESRARTGKGFKKLDVNYSTLELGLALGVSIKSVNFPEGASRNYAKNVTARDNELRAEAEDYHLRQPYAVLVALYFMPEDAAANATNRKPSSFGHMAQYMRHRAGRLSPTDQASLFEKVYIGLYVPNEPEAGKVSFFDVEDAPPKNGVPKVTLTFTEVLEAIWKLYTDRNRIDPEWAKFDP